MPEFVARHAGIEERPGNSSSFCSSLRIYDIFVSDKPMTDMIKRARSTDQVFCGMYSQRDNTRNHTLRRSLDHWSLGQFSAVKLETNWRYTLCICLYFCSFCLYIFTYIHKFSLKVTLSACVRISWEDTIAVLLLWKILTWKCFLCQKMHCMWGY